MISCENMYQRIEAMSAQKGMSVNEMAQAAGVNPVLLDNLKNGVKGLNMGTMALICKELGISAIELMQEKTSQKEWVDDPNWREHFERSMKASGIDCFDLADEMGVHPNFVRSVLLGNSQMPFAEKRFRNAMTRIRVQRAVDGQKEPAEAQSTAPAPKQEKERTTATLEECRRKMLSIGIHLSNVQISDAIVEGFLPFGKLVRTGETGRRTFSIPTADFEKWLAFMEGALH